MSEPGIPPVPDVTVVVAVYNTMPYLTECLDSLVRQSIGVERLQIVAVDDGSTDGSGAELDRFASLHPRTFTVVHQANSGGPAAPSNRALDLATGRYVFFIGSDDHLGDEALERMVAYADEHGSDVVVGKMVGVNGRYVHQALYRKTDPDVGLFDSAMPFTLANTKLFRRALVEKYGLRFPEDLPVGSDQPFTIEACVRAAKISVLADYTYYYAVKRADAGNITYRANHLSRLECTARIMHHAAGLIPPGRDRDALFKRHFQWEIAKLVQADFARLDTATQAAVCDGIASLADAYLTDALRDSLDVKRRVRVVLAQHRAVSLLNKTITAVHGAPPFLLDGGRAYACYPGLRDPEADLPDEAFELIGEAVPGRLAQGTKVLSLGWELEGNRLALAAEVHMGIVGDAASAVLRLADRAMPATADKPGALRLKPDKQLPRPDGTFTTEALPDARGTVLRARVPIELDKATRGVRLYVDVAGSTYEIPLQPRDRGLPLPCDWRGFKASLRVNGKKRLVVDTAPSWESSPAATARVRRGLSRLRKKTKR
ncbi:glycosyltransferase family 2 protein [Streptomyces montanisoli]|uniref:Glycosyltransferase family 2 protein n=1 Tax=Streptomyces montanisoli TaxID=2798581 RepID=A0A940MBX7_9ACTN|nr:glycosyltransferase family 2 protein [Streptomyces montanisoli]MBP0458464.1 glycosyltransferase family 2 protein [Streptomyces montanisoli]